MSKQTKKANENAVAEKTLSPIETAGALLSKEARLFGRVANGAERAVFEALAAALKDPAKVKAFIGSAA